jgi:hypothetical protein
MNPLVPITIISEHGDAVAAIIPTPLTPDQFDHLTDLLPWHIFEQSDLAQRWQVHQVLALDDWASTQRRRVPCFKPHGFELAFL